MQEVQIIDKQKYLEQKYPFSLIPLLKETRCCLQCGKEFLVADYKVFKSETGREIICCPDAPACRGTVTDWYRKV